MSTDQLRSSFDDVIENRYELGFVRPSTQLTQADVPMIVSIISYHISVESCRSELDQLAEGLQLFGFLQLAIDNPTPMSSLLEIEHHRLTADRLQDLLNRTFAEAGSTARLREENISILLNNILFDIEGKQYIITTNYSIIPILQGFERYI